MKRALQIGINYFGTQHELRGCINDVKKIEERLRKKYGYSEFIQMTDDVYQSTPNMIPTRNNILRVLVEVLETCQNGDSLFFQYSGHGTYVVDTSGDEKDGRDEAIVTCDSSLIVDDEINEILEKHLKDGVKLFVLFDACHSGTNLDLTYQLSVSFDHLIVHRNDRLCNKNIVYISGCTDATTSADAKMMGTYCGAMTWAFLHAISKPKCIWPVLMRRMHALLNEKGYPQRPQICFSCYENALQNFSL